jgi:hypothetical protein
MNVSATETIAAPIERVFEVLGDIEHAQERIPGITKLEILSDIRSGKGVRWRETRTMFGKEATEVMEMTEFTPPTSYRVEAASHGMKYVSVFRFRAVDDKATEVNMTFAATPQTLFARLMTPVAFLFKGVTRKALHQDILSCKRYIEASGA